MANILGNITQRGTQAKFMEAMGAAPNVWENHVTKVPSNQSNEMHVWMGMLPQPRELLGDRQFRGLNDFSFNVVNRTYELSFLIERDTMEDDTNGTIDRRIAEAANTWAAFKDSQIATLLTNGATATTTYDGVSFFNATRTIGSSAAIDNLTTSAAAATGDIANAPTGAEALTGMQLALAQLWNFQDDQGVAGYNNSAMGSLRAMVSAEQHRGFVEAVNSTLIGGGDSNPWGLNLMEVDVNPFLAVGNDKSYIHATGDPNKRGILYQERTPLEVVVLNGRDDVAENNGVKVLIRQRYFMTYGEPRRMIEHTWS